MKAIKEIFTLAFAWEIMSAPAYGASCYVSTPTYTSSYDDIHIEECERAAIYTLDDQTFESCLTCATGSPIPEDIELSVVSGTCTYTRYICAHECDPTEVTSTGVLDNCESTKAYEWDDKTYLSCTYGKCKSGFKNKEHYVSSERCTSSFTYYTCERDPDVECITDSECDDDDGNISYADDSGRLGDYVGGSCINNKCEYEFLYYCNDGYYPTGASSFTTSLDDLTCTECPSEDGGIPVYTVDENISYAEVITDCFAASGIQGKNRAGTYSFTGQCYYSE